MKHRSRLEREAKEDEEKKYIFKLMAEERARLTVILARLNNLSGTGAAPSEDAEVFA